MAEWKDVCADDLIRFDYGARTFVIARDDADYYYCPDRLCTHEEVHLAEGLVIEATVECPKHSSVFDCATGEPETPPACATLGFYQPKVENGRVLVAI